VTRFRYLNGIDWVVTGLDRSLRQAAGSGNWSQIVMELDGRLDFESFRNGVQRYASAFPVLQGRAVRGWQLVPVWKIPKRSRPVSVPIKKHLLPDDASFETVTERLGQCVTVASGTPGRYIGFNLLYAGAKTFLAFRFDHQLFDARGAELFIQGLIRHLNAESESPLPRVEVPPQKPCLPPWIPKFKSGQQVVRMLHRQRHEAAPFNLTPGFQQSPSFRFSVIPLDRAKSDRLLDRAYKEAGYLMLTPWLADRMTAALDRLNPAAGEKMNGYMIPCSADLRSGSNPQMFFNHTAFICLHRPKESSGEEGWARHFSQQFFEQVKADMPRHFENAWKLARIIPASLFGRLLRKELNPFAGTFSMASVGAGLSAIEAVGGGCAVQNVFHMPVVPPAPGLGFFANSFQGCMNFCLTSAGSTLSDREHAELTRLLTSDLLSPS